MYDLRVAGLADRRFDACVVRLENCRFASSVGWPTDMIDEGSTGPYVLEWVGCSRFDGSELKQFKDDRHSSIGGLMIETPPE